MNEQYIQEAIEAIEAFNFSNELQCYDIMDILHSTNFVDCWEYGEDKVCFWNKNWDFVIKFTFPNIKEDKALMEVNLYSQAEENGLQNLFCKTEYFYTKNDINYIIQEKIQATEYNIQWHTSYVELKNKIYEKIKVIPEDTLKEAYNNSNEIIKSFSWIAMVIMVYGKEFYNKLCTFIKENNINDLHIQNIGYINEKPVILDFCGYYS